MAVNLFPSQQQPQLIHTNRELDFIKENTNQNANLFNTQMDPGFVFNESMPETTLLPIYHYHHQQQQQQQQFICDLPAKTSMNNKDDSGLTYINNNNVPSTATAAPMRKRPRDSNFSYDLDDSLAVSQKPKFSGAVVASGGGLPTYLDEDVIFQIQHQQSEIDTFVAQHNQKVMMELEQRRRRQSRMLVAAIQESVTKRLKEKDEELQKMGKFNWALQEKVKSLLMENQIWRELAQTNEARANSLRTNLEQVLAHVSEDRHVSGGGGGGAAMVADDAESSCGSSDDDGRCTLAAGEEEVDGGGAQDKNSGRRNSNNNNNKMLCKKCGEKESSVLLLPCRHLCLCTMCGSTLLGTCPVCDFVMNASVHVNMS